MDTTNRYKLAFYIAIGVILGMLLAAPSIFIGDIVFGGIAVGLIFAVVTYFLLRRKLNKMSPLKY